MCFTGGNTDFKEQVVDLALKKRVRNKRKRDPDMCVEVLLTSTVRRLRCELENDKYYVVQAAKRLKISKDEEEKMEEQKPEPIIETVLSLEDEVERAVESLTSLQESPSGVTDKSDSSLICSDNVVPETPSYMSSEKPPSESLQTSPFVVKTDEQYCDKTDSINYDDIDFDALVQNLLDICEPLSCNVDDLMKEYSIDPCMMNGTVDFLGHNDPFLPGMFEVMCS